MTTSLTKNLEETERKIEKRIKIDDLSYDHLAWLIKSRERNQTSCLNLFRIFEMHPLTAKNNEYRNHSQTLVSVGFSLWRAAFLADKTGQREEVFADAKAFLARILTDNAVNYPQDRSSREWTWFGGALPCSPSAWLKSW